LIKVMSGIKPSSFLKRSLKLKGKRTLFIYCENGCGNELCSSGSFVSDTYDENGENHVRYRCSKCGHESDYNFDLCMLPINWKELTELSK
jgi:RNase P subunit RPR2